MPLDKIILSNKRQFHKCSILVIINQMVDFTSINNQPPRLKLMEWFILHKSFLKRLFKYFLIVLSLALWGYGTYGLMDWFLITGPAERAAIARLHIDLVNYEARSTPSSLQARGVTLIPGVRFDALALVKNPNAKWYATFDYKFAIAGEETAAHKGFILPGEEKYVLDLGIQAKGKPTRAILTLSNVHFQRINQREIPDYGSYKAARLAFDTSGISYTPALQVAGRAVSRATFTVVNNSAFSYFEVPFQVFLYRGSVLAGVNQAILSNLSSGETRQVDVTWFDPLAGITKVEVKPDLNILDPSVYRR